MFDDFLPVLKKIKDFSIQERAKISSAESCTGGMIAACLTSLPGSSDFFDSGFVVYTSKSKQHALGVQSNTIEKYGTVSALTVSEMALGVLKNSEASISIATTGVLGPSSAENQAIGTVFFGCALGDFVCLEKKVFHGDRFINRYLAVDFALKFLLKTATDYFS